MSTDKRPFDENTVRVTNLPPDTTADELKSVFSAFGHVVRIYPAKDKLTQQNRVNYFTFCIYPLLLFLKGYPKHSISIYESFLKIKVY